jgi:hypothetical protein
MNTLTRINPLGHKYMLVRQAGGKTLVITGTKQVTMDMTIEDMSQCWYNWQMKRENIQVAFAQLGPEQREFLMTGITPSEWNEIFKDAEE